MEATHRTTTLAAQVFGELPELRETATKSPQFRTLSHRARTVHIDGQTYYLLEGDLLYDEDELQLYVLQQSSTVGGGLMDAAASFPIQPSPALVGISAGQRMVRWEPGKVLRYAVLRASFVEQDQYEVEKAA